jgi:hypothetical protein
LACDKNKLLNESPSSDLVKPQAYEHLLGLINDEKLMGQSPSWGEQSADDYWLDSSYYSKLNTVDRGIYTWGKDINIGTSNIENWKIPYSQIYQANLVLEGVPHLKMDSSLVAKVKNLQGYALFMRSFSFLNLLQVFADAYDAKDATKKDGIVLRITTKNERLFRSSIDACYQQILNDLKQSVRLLPNRSSAHLNLPSIPASYGLLTRVYLSMRDYTSAKLYADSCLDYYSALLDFRTLLSNAKPPIPGDNKEILYRSWLIESNQVIQATLKDCFVDSALYNDYDSNDLRKNFYFAINAVNKRPYFRGSFTGKSFPFTGLTTGEVLLGRAECNVRLGNVKAAMEDIDMLLINRCKVGTYQAQPVRSVKEALAMVLKERRKELIFRGLRWTDIKRLNKENAGINLRRRIGNTQHVLNAGHKNFLLPIPGAVIIGTDIIQNPRE